MAAFIASTYLHTHTVMHSEGTGPIEMFFPSVIVIFIAVSRYIDEIRFEYDLKISLLKHMMKNNKKKTFASKEWRYDKFQYRSKKVMDDDKAFYDNSGNFVILFTNIVRSF